MRKKINKYFVVKITRNEERLNKDVKRKFYDDCGAWQKVSYYKSYYICKSLKQVYFLKQKFCIKKKSEYEALNPQPAKSEIFELTRYNTKNKKVIHTKTNNMDKQ